MKALSLAAAGWVFALAVPAAAQTMDPARDMPGMTMPAAPAPAAPRSKPSPLVDPSCPPEHAAMGHCTPRPVAAPNSGGAMPDMSGGATATPPTTPGAAPGDPDCPPEHARMGHCIPKTAGDPHAGHAAPTDGSAVGGTALPAGDAPAPAAPQADYADRIWGRDVMAPRRAALHREHGGATFSQVMVNLAEVAIRDGRDAYRWDGQAWFGGDINRVTLKSEGEGAFGETVERAEARALYSRAVGPYFNLQAGMRHDFRPGPSRTYATLGFEGLAPYWFEVEGALFLSTKGEVLGRIEGYYDQRVTQRLILQPRAELNLAIQDVPAIGIGSGLTDAELGLRLRYEIVREFAPYIGLSWDRKFGDTARFARAGGEGTGGFALALGIRAWF